ISSACATKGLAPTSRRAVIRLARRLVCFSRASSRAASAWRRSRVIRISAIGRVIVIVHLLVRFLPGDPKERCAKRLAGEPPRQMVKNRDPAEDDEEQEDRHDDDRPHPHQGAVAPFEHLWNDAISSTSP